jgi:hypothetical protein
MNDISNMELSDLERLKSEYHNKINDLNSTLDEIDLAIISKRINVDNLTIKNNPYYRDKLYLVKITIDKDKYVITKIKPGGIAPCLIQYTENNLGFLKYYKMCTKQEWDDAISNFNEWFATSGYKVIAV